MVTFLGAVVRRMGSWMPIGGTVDLLAQAGFDSSSVRTAVFRLKKRGWLTAEPRAGRRGYALTDTALEALAAGDEVIWHARRPADLAEGWCVVLFSLPETARTERHQLRSHLGNLGFGNAGAGVWLAPARMRAAAERTIDELGLTSFCAVFVGNYVAGLDIADLVRQSWDLEAINHRYLEFIEAYQPVADQVRASRPANAADAFVAYLDLVDSWRKLPFRDPWLPLELLAPDWAASRATALFEQLVGTFEGRALDHAGSYWPSPVAHVAVEGS